ncbi:cytochrome b/b6 domain-containing protein [Myxococcota bacterium]|nr:cytochrome b/b6 domain-containing protein [Myxococcota bacterium]
MKKYPLQLRAWHWLHALVLFGLLGTFFLRKTFLSWRTNAQILSAKLAALNITITDDQASALAKAVRAPMWWWHYALGFAFSALLLWRLVMHLRGGDGGGASDDPHMVWVRRVYVVVYGILAVMALSGLTLYFASSLGLSKAVMGGIKGAHEQLAWGVVAFAAAHIIGVFAGEQRGQRGIVSEMISGDRPRGA